MYANQLIII